MLSDYLEWRSQLALEQVFGETQQFAYPHVFQDGIIFLGSAQGDSSRSVIYYRNQQQEICLTPEPLSLRTRIHEYGGKPFWLMGDSLLFVNDEDQALYRQTIRLEGKESLISSGPSRVSPLSDKRGVIMFGELAAIDDSNLICTVEQSQVYSENQTPAENKCFLGLISGVTADDDIAVLEEGADFYCNLSVNEQGSSIAWVEWDHPNMPWNENRLMVADLDHLQGKLRLINKREIDLPETASVCQLLFANNGNLFFSVDFASSAQADELSGDGFDYWNLWCIPFAAGVEEPRQITKQSLEFGYPHWQFGDHRIVQWNDQELLAIATGVAADKLFVVNQHTMKCQEVENDDWHLQNLASDGKGRALAIARSSTMELCVVELSTANPSPRIRISNSKRLSKDSISVAKSIVYPSRDGIELQGFYYAPKNSQYQAPQGALPPLLVMVHGGPTAKAYGYLDIQKQFWTQNGFAIFDVNHRGSCGFGRTYRDALIERWGIDDCNDIADGVRFLCDQGLADSSRVCIRGKSAGGYAVLRSLTEYASLYKAGACYYGIGNLATLAEHTHKFEKHYTDRLLGEDYVAEKAAQPDSPYQIRSPVNYLSKLQSAMIVFQGALDKIVPPQLAHEIINALKTQGLNYKYVEYDDEGHGFRNAANNVDAWSKELQFYRDNLA